MSDIIVTPNYEQAKYFGTRRAMLMECVEGPRKGLLGVHLQGGKFTVPLPAGYNGDTEVFYAAGRVFVKCPGQKTLVCDFNEGKSHPLA